MLTPPEQFWFTHIEQATSPSMDHEIRCRFCNRHRSFYGFIDGWCLVCWCSLRWSGTDYRLRAVASSASSRVNNASSKRVLLQGVTKDIVQQHLDGCSRAIMKAARRHMWKRILLGSCSGRRRLGFISRIFRSRGRSGSLYAEGITPNPESFLEDYDGVEAQEEISAI